MSQLDEAKKEGGDSRLGPGPVDRSDIVKFQLQQAVETYRSQISFVVQIYTILVLADVYVTGFALTAKAAAVVGLGALFPLAMFYVGWTVWKLSIPLLYYAVKAESLCQADQKGGLISTFVAFTQSPEYVRQMRTIAKEGTFADQIERLKALRVPAIRGTWISGRLLICALAVGQIGLAVVLHNVVGWPWFGINK